MSSAPLDRRERRALCDLFTELGPEAPTLCEGWATLDLAAHLVMRERDLRAGFVILGGSRFDSLGERLMDRTRSRGYATLVAQLRSGPPLHWRLPGVGPLVNLNEWFVHHEDVRRANGQAPRRAVDELDAELWRLLGRSSRLMLRGLKGTGLTLDAPGFGTRVVRKGLPMATMTGPPQELVLFLNGRRDAAEVTIQGDQPALDALAAARLGV
jgi:uncharacterized protein (TIGR03085 family)